MTRRDINQIGHADADTSHPHDTPAVDPEASDVPTTARRRRPVPFRKELPLLLWLVAAWVALTRDFSLMSLVFGAVLAWVIVHVFRLPPVELAGRFNIVKAVVMMVQIIWDAFIASVRVFRLAIFRGPETKSSILRVDLITDDDLIITAVSHALAIVPGSIVCEVDRSASRLYVHVLGVETDKAADVFIRQAHDTELRILEIMGRPEELQAARARAERQRQDEGTPEPRQDKLAGKD